MVEHNDEFGSSAPPPGGGSENLNFGAPNSEATVGDPSSPHGESFEDTAGHEAQFKHPHPAPLSRDDAPKHPLFPIALGGVMVVILAVAWYANSQKVEAPAAPTAAATPAAPEVDKPAAPAPEAEDKAFKGEIDGLKADLKALQARIEALPKPGPALDLGPLNSKLADLSKDTASLSDLPKKVDDLDQRLGSFDKTLAALRVELDTFKIELKKPVEPAGAAPETPRADDAKVAEAALDQGASLFRAGKYKEASDTFQKLTETSPNDARVWYFAALSRGSATNEWTGETTRLVNKAVELEKAGTPDSAKIDAAFTNLNPAYKPWFDAYRKMAKAR
jgi:tetratricopeptide (TPR) repeat protein